MSSLFDELGSLVRGAAIVFVGRVAGRALGLLGQVLIVRELTVQRFGHLALAVTIVAAAANVALLGVPQGVTRMLAADQRDERQRAIVRAGILTVCVSALAAGALVYALRFRIGALMDDPELPRLLGWLFPYFLAFALTEVTIAALRGWKHSVRPALVRDLLPRVGALAVFGAFAATGRPFVGALGYWLAAPVLGAVFGLVVVGQLLPAGVRVGLSRTRETAVELWSFSWPLAVGSSLVLLLSNMDLLMIGALLETTSIAEYRAIQPLREVTLFVVTSFAFLFYPIATEFYEADAYDDLDRLYTTATKWITAASTPVALTFVLFAPDVIRVLFTERYVPAAPALSVLIAGMFLRVVVGPNGVMLKAIDRPRVELVGSAAGLAVNVALNLLLIPLYGLVGAAAATGLGFAVFNGLEVAVIYRETGSHPFSLATLKPLVVTAGAGVALAVALEGVALSLAALLAVGAALGVVHILALFATRSLDAADLGLVERVEERAEIDLTPLKRAIDRQR